MKRNLTILSLIIFFFLSFAIRTDARNVQDNYKFTYTILNNSGDHVSGQSPTLQIQRVTDGYWFDFNDSTFKNSGWTSKTTVISEDSTNGFYYFNYDPPASETTANQYIFVVDNSDATYGDHQTLIIEYSDPVVNTTDPWSVFIPGDYAEGTAGNMLSTIKDSTDGDKEGSEYTGIEQTIRTQR